MVFLSKKQSFKKSLKKESSKERKFDFIKTISNLVAGKNTDLIVDILFEKENVNEFLIAKKLNLTINQIRNVLYRLSDEGLVSFVRKKDKKKGWYTYFWTFNSEKALVLLKKNILEEIENLKNQLKSRQSKQFYICSVCNSEITEENALLNDFTCPECGELYEIYESEKPIKEINSAIDKLTAKYNEIQSELEVIEEKKQKKAKRERKKEEKEKQKKRKEVAKKRAETRKKRAEQKKKESAKLEKAKKKIAKKRIAKKKTTKKKTTKKITKKKRK